jgi:hypothetical protein
MKLLEVRCENKHVIQEHLTAIPYLMAPPFDGEINSPRVYHGSPVPPEQMGTCINPVQARSGRKAGERVAHGIMAISTSAHPYFPIIRALIHNKRTDISEAGQRSYLFCVSNKRGDRYAFTPTCVYDLLTSQQSLGYVYGIEQPPTASTIQFEPEIYRGHMNEMRILEPTSWDWVASVDASDLPGDMFVIDGDNAAAQHYIDYFRESEYDPLILAEQLGSKVMSLARYMA